MAVLPNNPKCLELTMSIPGSSSSSSSAGGRGNSDQVVTTRDIDINRMPSEKESEYFSEKESEYFFMKVEEEENGGPPPRKKLRLTKEQSSLLEETFRQKHTLNTKQKEVLAMQLKLKARQVEVWFQNRRARSKLKQTEMDCEYLKRWFSSLTEQNKRLQKEVEELRAIKVDPPTIISHHICDLLPAPSTMMTMCPRCDLVTNTINNHGRAITANVTTPAMMAKDEQY